MIRFRLDRDIQRMVTNGFSTRRARERFALDHFGHLPKLAESERFETATLTASMQFTDASARLHKAKWHRLCAPATPSLAGDRPTEVVCRPKGNAQALRNYIEGTWGTIGSPETADGQGLYLFACDSRAGYVAHGKLGFAPCLTLPVGVFEAGPSPQSGQAGAVPARLVTGELTDTMNLKESQQEGLSALYEQRQRQAAMGRGTRMLYRGALRAERPRLIDVNETAWHLR